jgi:YesN/AraC family two-component response regulator
MITVAIVEDIKEIRAGLQMLINFSEGFSCNEVYPNAEEALEHLPEIKPDVVLMDINLPGMNGIDCVRLLKPLCGDTQFIMCKYFRIA